MSKGYVFVAPNGEYGVLADMSNFSKFTKTINTTPDINKATVFPNPKLPSMGISPELRERIHEKWQVLEAEETRTVTLKRWSKTDGSLS